MPVYSIHALPAIHTIQNERTEPNKFRSSYDNPNWENQSKQIHVFLSGFQLLKTLGSLGLKEAPMAVADSVFESLQCFQSMMESFDESLSQLRKDNSSESALALWKNLMEYYRDFHKALQSRNEAVNMKGEKREEPGNGGKNKEDKTSKVQGSSPASSSVSKVLSSVEVLPEIKIFFDKADAHGLINYIVGNLKHCETYLNEFSVALSKAPDAGKLVMKALEGYPLSENDSDNRTVYRKRACILLLESLFPVFGSDDSGVVPSDVKDSAREMAKVWRKNVKVIRRRKHGWNISAFLQLLVTFRIAADYQKDELLALVSAILSRSKTPELCRSLGLSSEVPNLMNKLPKRDRQLTVLKFAHVCGFMDKVDPVVLLTSYLRDEDKHAEQLLTNGHGSADSQLQSNTKKLIALENVLNRVKEYGLQSQFFGDNWEKKLREFEQERDELKKKIKKISEEKSAAEEEAREKEDGKEAAEKKAQEKEDGKKAVEKEAQEKEDGKKPAEKKAQEKDGKKAAEKKAHKKEDRQKALEKKAQEKEDGKKAAKKNIQHTRRQSFEPGWPSEGENYVSKRAKYASLIKPTSMAGGMGNSKASPYNIDGVQNKFGIIVHDHHTSAFSAASRSSTGFAAGAFSSAPSTAAQINDERRRNPSALGTSNLTPIGSSLYGSSVPAGAFAVPMSNVGEVNYEGRGRQSYPMNFGEEKIHVRASVYGTGDLAKSSVTQSNYNYEGRGQQSYKLNFGEVDNNPVSASAYGIGILENSSATQSHYERRGRELFTSAFVGSNMSSIGTGDLAKSASVQSNYNYEGRGQQSYKLNFGEVDNNPVNASIYGIGILENSSATQSHCERRGRELYTSAFGGGNTSSIGSSVYGSNSRTIASSDVNQGGHERSLGHHSGFAGRNMVSIESSGYGPGVSTVPPSNVTQGHFESKGSVIDRYQFNSGLTSSPPA